MRKTLRLIVVMLAAALLLTGCDFLRSLAGRPTSAQIEQKAEAIETELLERQRIAEKARQDSLSRVKHQSDSLAAVEALSSESLIPASRLGGLKSAEGLKRYYIIMGSFSNAANAQRFCNDLTQKGFPSEPLTLGNGFTASGICGTDSVAEIWRSLVSVKEHSFCPKSVWILINE